MLWYFRPRLIIQKPTGERYFPKIVSASVTETREFSNPEFAEIEIITNRSPYTSEFVNAISEDDIVRLQVSCRMSPKEKYVFVDIFEGLVRRISGDYSTKNNTSILCKGHIDEATKLLIREAKTWTGTVEAREILTYLVNPAHNVTRLTWLNQAPYVDQTGSVSFTDAESAYATKADQTYLSTVFQDLEKQSGYNWKIGTKCLYATTGLLDKTYLTWKQNSAIATDKYKAIEGTARYLGSTFVLSIEDQATEYVIKGDTPEAGTQYSGSAININAVSRYGYKTDVDVFTQLQSNATCKSIAEGALPDKIQAEITGSIKLVGTPDASAGDVVYVKTRSTELNGGVISGNFDVSRVRHVISSNSYHTEIQVGGIVENAYDLIAKIKKTSTVTKCNQVK